MVPVNALLLRSWTPGTHGPSSSGREVVLRRLSGEACSRYCEGTYIQELRSTLLPSAPGSGHLDWLLTFSSIRPCLKPFLGELQASWGGTPLNLVPSLATMICGIGHWELRQVARSAVSRWLEKALCGCRQLPASPGWSLRQALGFRRRKGRGPASGLLEASGSLEGPVELSGEACSLQFLFAKFVGSLVPVSLEAVASTTPERNSRKRHE